MQKVFKTWLPKKNRLVQENDALKQRVAELEAAEAVGAGGGAGGGEAGGAAGGGKQEWQRKQTFG